MKALAASLLIAAVATPSSADAVARAVELCMDIPLDGVPVSETFVADGWEPAETGALATLTAPHACGDREVAETITEQFAQTLDFAGGLFARDQVIVLAADNRGGDILDRVCFVASPQTQTALTMMAGLPASADRPALGYAARETEPENFVEAFGWRGDEQVHAGICENQSAIKIRRLMRKIPQ